MSGKPITIRVAAALSGANRKIGEGIVASAQFMVGRCQGALRDSGYVITVEHCDDHDSVTHLKRTFQRSSSDDDLAIIVGSSSRVVESFMNDLNDGDLPFLCTYATSSSLPVEKYARFYRFQSRDIDRARALVECYAEQRRAGSKPLHILKLEGAPESYAMRLGEDAATVCRELSVPYQIATFSPSYLDRVRLPDADALLICSPSAEAVMLIRQLNKLGWAQPTFAFGSNSNFLTRDCLGLTVITDVDRQSDEASRRKTLEDFRRDHPNISEPSVSTMVAVGVIINFLTRHNIGSDVSNRDKLSDYLNQTPLGPFGRLAFDDAGELVERDCTICTVDRNSSGEVGFYRRNTIRPSWRIGVALNTGQRLFSRFWRAVSVVSTLGGAVTVLIWIWYGKM